MKYIVLLIVAFSSVPFLYSQCDFSLKGKVIDMDTGAGVGFCSVSIQGTGVGVYADSLGGFILSNLCKGDYQLEISHVDCETKFFSIHIEKDHTEVFKLSHALYQSQTIVIQGKAVASPFTQSASILTDQALSETYGQTLGKGLEKLLGVTSLQTGSTISKPVIHGMHSNRILILNNGIRQEAQQWGSEHAPEIDPFLATRLTVVKGADAVRYGSDAMGGVIIVEPSSIRDSSGLGATLIYAGFSNNRQHTVSGNIAYRLSRKWSPLAFRLQGTWKKGGNIRTPDYYLKNTGVREQNFSGTAVWQKNHYQIESFYSQFYTRLGIFSGSHIGNLTDLLAVFQNGAPYVKSDFSYTIGNPFQNVRHHLWKNMFSYQHPTLGNLQLTYSRQVNHREEYDNHTILDTLGNEVAALNYKITTQTLDAFWRMKKAGNFRTSGGVSVMTQANLMGGARYFLPNYINYTGGVFAATRYKKEKWEWEVGARYDYRYMEVYLYENKIFQKDILRFSNISFNGGFLWRDEHWKISGNIGRAWRAPGMNELYSNGLHHGSAALEVGNRTLKEEKAWKGIANISFSHPNWECEIAPYSHYFQNYIYLQPTQKIVLTVRGAFPEFEYRQARAWLNGCDYQFKYSPDAHFSFFTKGAMLYARNLTTQTGLILMPPNRMEHGISYKGKGLKWAKTPTISANILHVFRQNNIPPNQDFTPAPQAYYLVGMESSCTIDWGKNALHLGIGVQNLLNKRYRDYLDRFRYFADAQGRNISFRAAIHINQ